MINAYQIDGGYLVDGPSFHGGYLMGGVWDLRYWPLVEEYQVHGNIDNCGDGDGDGDENCNSSSKIESYDLVPCYSADDAHAPSIIEVTRVCEFDSCA